MEKVRRQHYVPRMYLKRFGYGNIDDEYISVLKLDNGIVLDNRKVKNFAVENYFYDADKEQIVEILKEDLKVFPELCDNEKLSDEQFTEHALAREESAISKMLNELQEDLSRIHISSNRNLMIIFLHSLAYRTKQFRDQMDAINNKTEKWLSSMCDNLGLDEETKKKTIETNCSKDGKTIYTTDVIVEEHEFAQNKDSGAGADSSEIPKTDKDGFMEAKDGEIPFD